MAPLQRWALFLSRFRLDLPIDVVFSANRDDDGRLYLITTTTSVMVCPDGTTRKIPVVAGSPIPDDILPDTAQAIYLVRAAAHAAYQHEVDEWLRFCGEKVSEPHASARLLP